MDFSHDRELGISSFDIYHNGAHTNKSHTHGSIYATKIHEYKAISKNNPNKVQ